MQPYLQKWNAKRWKRSIVYNHAPIGSFFSSGGDSQDNFDESQQLADASSSTSDSAGCSETWLCNPILAFIKASRLCLDVASIKKSLVDRFCDGDLSEAMKQLWDFSSDKLVSLGFEYHVWRATGKQPANAAACDDLLLAFDKLDSSASVPPTYIL